MIYSVEYFYISEGREKMNAKVTEKVLEAMFSNPNIVVEDFEVYVERTI